MSAMDRMFVMTDSDSSIYLDSYVTAIYYNNAIFRARAAAGEHISHFR